MTGYRLCIPIVEGRGPGLANLLFVWAKAVIAGHELGVPVVRPALSFNPRNYRSELKAPRWDRAAQEIVSLLVGRVRFDDVARANYPKLCFRQAVRQFALETAGQGRVLGMAGLGEGPVLLRKAREPILAVLLNGRHSQRNLLDLERRGLFERFSVAIHVRRGDFKSDQGHEDFRGRFNTSVPSVWYVNILRQLHHFFGESLSVMIFSDDREFALSEISPAYPGSVVVAQANADVSDLLAMSKCDLVVCSVSSYSMAACALSGARYVWFSPQLTPVGGGAYIWPSSPLNLVDGLRQTRLGSEPFKGRGVAVDVGGELPSELLDFMRLRICHLDRRGDLMEFGTA